MAVGDDGRGLDRLHERRGDAGPSSRFGTIVLVSIGGACLAFGLLAGVRRSSATAPARPDALGQLIERNKGDAGVDAGVSVSGSEVNFPGILSDAPRPTTALAVLAPVDAGAGDAAAGSSAPPGAMTAVPPPAGDRLPVVPLPAQAIVAPSPVLTRPRDVVTQLAHDVSTVTGGEVAEGKPGLYQLHVSTFRTQPEADQFATALRQRGHRAYVEPAQLPGRGTWYRVRIGQFRSLKEAATYRAEFERKENIVPYLVDPNKEAAKEKQAAAEAASEGRARGAKP